MSEHDDTLLDGDLGDEEYDLGNDEEEALLADDYDVERQNSYKAEEETDDVLDLGVTDALDDLEAEDENIDFVRSKTDSHNANDFYNDDEHREGDAVYYEQDENNDYKGKQIHRYEANSAGDNINISNTIEKGDLREKLQKNSQKTYLGDGQSMEDEDCEEARERRNRFQNERTMISPKMNSDIPDSLENVVTTELSRPSFRGRGRGRNIRGSRGGRFIPQNSGNFNPRFGAARGPAYDNQQPVCRPPLLDTRPPFLLGVPNTVQNQQIVYQQTNHQIPFQQFSPNGPLQGPFIDNRPQFNANQFQGPVGPRAVGPRLVFEPRGSVAGTPFSCPPNQLPYLQIPPGPFQNSGTVMQDNQGRPVQSNQNPLLHGNAGGSLLGTPNPLIPGNPPPLLQNNQALPIQGFGRQQTPVQGPPVQGLPNQQIPSQGPFENRPSFQEPHFDSRPSYPDQIPNNQFNSNNNLPVPQPPTSTIPNVSLPPGHKILINPHFRGAVQPTNDARLVWDSTQQTTPQSQISGNQFTASQPSYQSSGSYNSVQSGSAHYQPNVQQSKNDDPYAYFSDVWQENRPQKPQTFSPNKQFPPEHYSRASNYNENGNKYKSDNQWERSSYHEEHRIFHQNYRERDVSSRSRTDHVQKSRTLSSSTYRNDPYEQSQRSPNNKSLSTGRGSNRLPQKRISNPESGQRDLSPKRVKPSSRNLQEVRTVDALNDTTEEKKEEDNDPDMQEYRKKMEEQKRLREKILREKENRRKMAAMEKQNEETKTNSTVTDTATQQETKPVSVLMGVVKDLPNKNRTSSIGRGRTLHAKAQAPETTERAPVCLRIVRTVQTGQPDETEVSAAVAGSDSASTKQPGVQSGTRRVVIQKPLANSVKVATTIQKTVSNLQNKSNTATQNVVQKITLAQSNTSANKPSGTTQKNATAGQRVVTQKPSGGIQKTIANETTSASTQKVIVNTQSSQRVVLQKPLSHTKKLPEIRTNTVKVENLAASTSEAQIRRMCQGIGTIESIQMGEGNATIVFKTQSAAMVFHKKYQRKMLDLSLITVHLVPQTGGSKPTTAAVKKPQQ